MRTPTCDECVNRMYTHISYMGDEELQVEVLDKFMESGFCDQFGEEKVEQCTAGLELVLPMAMTMIAEADVEWATEFCSNQINCM